MKLKERFSGFTPSEENKVVNKIHMNNMSYDEFVETNKDLDVETMDSKSFEKIWNKFYPKLKSNNYEKRLYSTVNMLNEVYEVYGEKYGNMMCNILCDVFEGEYYKLRNNFKVFNDIVKKSSHKHWLQTIKKVNGFVGNLKNMELVVGFKE